jgi:hypothetical protein
MWRKFFDMFIIIVELNDICFSLCQWKPDVEATVFDTNKSVCGKLVLMQLADPRLHKQSLLKPNIFYNTILNKSFPE